MLQHVLLEVIVVRKIYKMEVTAITRNLRRSPRKVRLITSKLRGMSVIDAKNLLKNSDQDAAFNVLQTLNSAVANAIHNNGLNEVDLFITKAIANEGRVLKRIRFGGRGKIKPIKKRSSHIQINVSTKEIKEENGSKD